MASVNERLESAATSVVVAEFFALSTKFLDRSELLVLDATNLGAKPVARVVLPQRVPFGFHGLWVAADG